MALRALRAGQSGRSRRSDACLEKGYSSDQKEQGDSFHGIGIKMN
ncbi:hypothetical protein C943_02638 [Mariniradius saccharolyticus AK6]|uniref:Uncharacterized protein n=1 Tax=Mariniradius saccharolyticus AK6 TaxID=1239962 RepID=M7X0L4_9BACT|nr:hypothetical protein C943_02638 [Mariniradius saccharolyticus AK6]